MTLPQLGKYDPLRIFVVTDWSENIFILVNLVPKRFNYCFVPAKPRSNTSHTRACESVQHKVSRHRVMEDVAHYCFVRNLCMVTMCCVNWIILSFTYISCKWLLAVNIIRAIWLSMELNEIRYKGIRASRIVRRIR